MVSTYIHEATHRLLGEAAMFAGDEDNHGHDAAFFCLELTLYLRVDSDIEGRASLKSPTPLWQSADLYDLQNAPNIPAAFAWAWNLAHGLAHSEASAEKIAGEIHRIWKENTEAEDIAAKSVELKLQAANQQLNLQVTRNRDSFIVCLTVSLVALLEFVVIAWPWLIQLQRV